MTEAAQGWPFGTVSSEAFLIAYHPSRSCCICRLHPTLSSHLYFCVSLSLLLSLSLPVCFSFLLIKQGQTGFVSLIQTEGVSTSPTLEKRRETREDRGQVSDCTGRTPRLWELGGKHRFKTSTHHGSLPGRPGAFPPAMHRPLPPGWNLAGSREKHPIALGSS